MNLKKFLKEATAVLTGAALFVPGIFLSAADVNAATSYKGLDAASHTKAEIISYVKAHPWNNDAVTFKTEPSATDPYVLGRVSDESAQSALNYLNIFRYIAGVNEVSLTDTAMDYAQAASLCMAINRSLSHSPSRPAGMSDDLYSLAAYGSFNSNIAGGGNSLTNTILRYMLETNGDTNFGHRRQLLDYYYTDAGFGAAASTSGSYYSATYVDAYLKEDKAISYPGQYQPIEYFGTGYAWTVIVPQTIDTTTAHVTVTDVNKGTVWEFENNSDPGHQYMRIDKDSKSACLIFAPEDILYRDGDVYNVKITGIPSPISYDVHMFNIDNIPVESVRLSYYTPSTVAGQSVTGSGDIIFTPENASNKIMNWTSSDESIATVKNYGTSRCTIYGVKEGKVTITGRPEGGTGEVSFEFEVKPAPTAINVPDEITVGVGQSVQLEPSVTPSNSPVTLSYSRNDTSIATIGSYTGKKTTVTGVAKGTTQLSVRVFFQSSGDHTYDSLTKTVKVNVVDPVYISSLSVSGKTELFLDEENNATYIANISPSNATCKEVEWSSSSSSFKSMGNGVFKVSTYGKFTITAAAKDGSGIEDSLEVIVYKKYATPSAPVLRTVTSDSVTLSASSYYEYSMDGINWQSSNQFMGLKPDTTYSFYVRRVGNPACYLLASDASEPLTVTTSSCVHNWNLTSTTTNPTCVDAGVGIYTCSKCGTTKQDEIPTVGHKSVTDKSVAATCTTSGLTAGSHCSVCGEVITAQQTIAAKGHRWDSGVITRRTTCTEDGIRTYTCYICGDTRTESIPATGHTEVTDKEVAATCTSSGLTAGSHCSVCRKVITAQQVVPAKGHKTVTDKAVAETCTTSGLTAGSHCSVCGKVITAQQVVPATGHSWSEGVLTKKATFDEPGVRTYTCKNCGKTREEATFTGIRKDGDVWVYYEDDVAMTDFTGKVKYDGNWYYLEDGEFQTGWKTISEKQYYFETETGVMVTGWKTIDGKRYYFNKTTGVVTTGWKKISKKYYYFNPDKKGAAVTGAAKKISGKYYLFDAKGVMLTSGWKKDSKGNTYYLKKDGVAYTKKWAKKSKKWYYFGSNGKMVVNKSMKIGKKTYKFDKKGVCKNP